MEDHVAKGYKHTPEARAKMRITRAAQGLRREPALGHYTSPETRAKMSASAKARPPRVSRPASAETKAKISTTLMGHRQSDETRAKRSASLKGRIFSTEWKRKISASKIGEKNSQWGTHRSTEERQYLSRIQAGTRTGDANPNWKGGVRINGNGYEAIRVHKRFYLLAHRTNVAKALGHPLKKGEIVHHINGNRGDSRIDNLALCSNAAAHGWCATEEARVFLGT